VFRNYGALLSGSTAGTPKLIDHETAHWLEWIDWVNPVLQQPYKVKNGQVVIPERPGLGRVWDEDLVASVLVEL
jgi:L-alanine-DL-glutamate epimerase-like enolase superfamily enzyme